MKFLVRLHEGVGPEVAVGPSSKSVPRCCAAVGPLDLVMTYGLSVGGSPVVDLAVSDHFCVFFNITSFNQRGPLWER
ncbi:hypothetical protein D4764_04G0000760 [Takifugu flavidus]|uniref:Uncharacterized protein n=1 Tax=Takifugu flavidus TaxID=433684 RepID=A0A5C6N6K1_9TELE|nr:hypothetical protein D4764_04G0000760 [Takifugu flavidus]